MRHSRYPDPLIYPCAAGIILLVLVALAGVLFAAPALARRSGAILVTPGGAPFGGQWQRWVDNAQVPTPPLRIVKTPLATLCWTPDAPTGGGCSSTGPPWELAAVDRASLYAELGHIFDASQLHGWERQQLARRWGHPTARWSDSSWALGHGIEDGLMVVFAEVYGDCAAGIENTRYLVVSAAPTVHTGPWACRFIRSVGR